MDSNNNHVPDKVEALITYIIAAICIGVAIAGYFIKEMDPGTLKWLIGFAVFLSGERDLKSFWGK